MFKILKEFLKIHIFERTRLYLIKITRQVSVKRKEIVLDTKRKFLFNTQYIWAFSELEFMSAAQLREEGHEIIIIICDKLPYTEREIIGIKPMSFKNCTKRTIRYCKAYGLSYLLLSSFISEKDKSTAFSKSTDKINKLLEYKKDNINIGELAKRNHAHFYKGDIEPKGEYEAIFRKAFESALLIEMAMSKILDKYRNFDLITANGKFIQTAIPAIMSKARGNSFFTYEVFTQGNGVILDKNKISLEQRIDDVWEYIKNTNLSSDQKSKLNYSFWLQEQSKSSAFNLWDNNIISDENEICKKLNIDPSKNLLICFPNVYWDSTHMGLNGVSKDLTTWLFDMIEFVRDKDDFQLIIRAHPGEIKVPKVLQSKKTILDSIKAKVIDMPKNIVLIEPTDQISSYTLASLANANLVWNGTIGLEIAMKGIKPIVVADAYYSNKGFTLDYLKIDRLFYDLQNEKISTKLSIREKQLLEVFCYHIRFNRKFNPPYYKGYRATIYNYQDIMRGRNSALDNMVGYFLDKNNYMNIGEFNFD